MISGQTTTYVGKIRRGFKKSATTKALLILRISSMGLKGMQLPVGERLGSTSGLSAIRCNLGLSHELILLVQNPAGW
jgi:hypothetical protein